MKNNSDELIKFCSTLKCNCGKVWEIYDIKSTEYPNKFISHTIQLNCNCENKQFSSWRKINIRVNN